VVTCVKWIPPKNKTFHIIPFSPFLGIIILIFFILFHFFISLVLFITLQIQPIEAENQESIDEDNSMVKSCKFCGRFFVPDRRVGERQKACRQERCRKARKQLAQTQWTKKNPAYFKGRYEYVKEWRERQKEIGKKVIQDKITPSKPWYKLVLLIPGGIKTSMIQDKIILERVRGRTFWAYGGG
jgi:hypothetical protein